MSKAFTRESDDSPEPVMRRPAANLPVGAKNYLTASGARRMREELERLTQKEPPALQANVREPAGHQRLQAFDQQIFRLNQSLQSAVIVTPPEKPDDQVRFGATVTVRESGGEETTYRIVGVDEIDIDQGWISWLSPIAKALINTRVGDQVRLKFPSGSSEVEVLRVIYE